MGALPGSATADEADQVGDDQDVEGEPGGLERAWPAGEFVELERDEQGGGKHGQPFRPAFAPEEADPLHELEQAVEERASAEEGELVFVQAAELADQVTDEGLARVELDTAREPVCERAEVSTRVAEQVGAGGQQEQTAQRPLGGDPGQQ